jgi:hypothetical protein
MQIGGSATAEIATALDELHAVVRIGEGASSAQAGYAAADDGDGTLCELLRSFRQAFPQGLKPNSNLALFGTTEVVLFHNAGNPGQQIQAYHFLIDKT